MNLGDEELIKWVKECPECAAAKIERLQIDLEEWKSMAKHYESENIRLGNQIHLGY